VVLAVIEFAEALVAGTGSTRDVVLVPDVRPEKF
jgi:hypothetical protein